MSMNRDQNITDYSQKGTLTRVFMSPMWGAGFMIGVLGNAIKETGRKGYYKDANKRQFAENIAYTVADVGLKTATMFGAGGVVAQADEVTPTIMLVSAFTDAMGVGTGKPFGAFRAGFAQGYEGGVPMTLPQAKP